VVQTDHVGGNGVALAGFDKKSGPDPGRCLKRTQLDW